jgi:hypothetical protein
MRALSIPECDHKITARPQLESGYLNIKVKSMKSTVLAVSILFSLAAPVSVLAEVPAVAAKPLTVEVVPIDVEATAQQAVTETLTEAQAPVTEASEQQAVVESFSETAVTTARPIEPQGVSETPAEAAVQAAERVEEQAAAETASQEAAAGTMASGADTPGQPCPMHGMGMMHKGMGQHGKGPGGSKPGCDRHGKGQKGYQQQMVRRLDMIEARMAKIEAMLESLMQR